MAWIKKIRLVYCSIIFDSLLLGVWWISWALNIKLKGSSLKTIAIRRFVFGPWFYSNLKDRDDNKAEEIAFFFFNIVVNSGYSRNMDACAQSQCFLWFSFKIFYVPHGSPFSKFEPVSFKTHVHCSTTELSRLLPKKPLPYCPCMT